MHARGPGVTVINMEIPVPGLPETIGIAGKLLSKYTVSVGQKWHCTTIGSKVCWSPFCCFGSEFTFLLGANLGKNIQHLEQKLFIK